MFWKIDPKVILKLRKMSNTDTIIESVFEYSQWSDFNCAGTLDHYLYNIVHTQMPITLHSAYTTVFLMSQIQ